MAIRDWVLGKAIDALLTYKSRPSSIRRAIAARRLPHADHSISVSVNVAVVQMRLELVNDGVEFAEKYVGLVAEAVDRGAQLVVFPEYAWLPILGLLPPVRNLAQKGVTLENAAHELAPGGGLTVVDVLQTIAPAVRRVFETTAAELAVKCGVYLMPGTALTTDSAGHLFNTAYLYGPDGRLIGTQHKLHPTPMEKDWLTCGSKLDIWKTPIGKITAPVCMDFTYWETARVATMRGADILLDMSADATADQSFMAARGDESRVQESFAYSTRAFCVTQLFGLNFCGPSHVAASLGLVSSDTPFLARAKTSDQEEIISAQLNLARLSNFRANHPFDWNTRLYEKYLPEGYSHYRQHAAQQGRRVVY